MQACGGISVITPLSLKLSSAPITLFAAKDTRTLVIGGWVGLRNVLGCFVQEKEFFLSLICNPYFPARS